MLAPKKSSSKQKSDTRNITKANKLTNKASKAKTSKKSDKLIGRAIKKINKVR